ncbi:hypothetical protein BGX26_012371, partial [Mortierella sp. AD094]
VAKAFTAQEIEELREKFTAFDRNHDGRVDRVELHELTKSLGEPATDDELEFVIKSFDANGDGSLDFKEFLDLMTTLREVGRD